MALLSTVLQLVGGLAAYELVRFVVVRRLRRRILEGAVEFVRRHRIQLESARFIDRVWIREALAQDRVIQAAIAEQARATEASPLLLRHRVDAYVDEIAPFFSLSAYYRFGAYVGRRIVDFCFEVVIEPGAFERQRAKVPEGALRVYVINHRANMDPLVLAFGLLRHVPMSYAVGEWALVWPLHTVFRAFGSYFVRRGEKDPLYHVVLERFVQLMASEGAVTGFFIEGGLSRDGALRTPRTGLLDYLIKVRREHPDREIAFMPVGLNYDRVLEDRILTRELEGPLPQPTRWERLINLLALLFWVPQLVVANLLQVAMRSHRKFGYAAITFGEPLLLSAFPGGSELHARCDEERHPEVQRLAEELVFDRIGAVVPATPIPILCAAMVREGPDDSTAIVRRVREVLSELRAAGAPVAFGEAFGSIERRRRSDDHVAIDANLDAELLDMEEAEQVYLLASHALVRRRVLRRVVTPTGKGVEVVEGSEEVVAYYANSIRHHLETTPPRS